MTEADLLVPFKPGTEVMDWLANVAYRVEEGGKVTPMKWRPTQLSASPEDLARSLSLNPLEDDIWPDRPSPAGTRRERIAKILAEREALKREGKTPR